MPRAMNRFPTRFAPWLLALCLASAAHAEAPAAALTAQVDEAAAQLQRQFPATPQ